MKQVSSTKLTSRNRLLPSNLDSTQRRVLIGGLVIFFILLLTTTLILAYYVFEPEVNAFLAVPTATLIPTPTPMCVQPTLQLGAEFYALQVVTEPGDGSLSAPGGPPGTAWWISGTFSPFVFVFDPLIGSLGLNTQMQPGEPIIIQWADCGREEFVLTAIQPGSPDTKELLAQSTPGIAVIILPTGNAEGFVLQGQRPELVNPPTPEPTGENVILFNLTFGETTVSEDQATLTTHLTLTNDDDQVIHLAQDDLSLTAEGQQPLAPLSVEPALPQDIQPGQSLEVTVTFPNPGGQSAVLKVLDLTVDLYY